MKNKYAVRLSRIKKYYGIVNETHKQGQIHEEEYIFHYEEYKDALDEYHKHCESSARNICMQGVFSSTYTIQLLDWEGTNPNKSQSDKRRIMFQISISNV
jgi:hypothetical protein